MNSYICIFNLRQELLLSLLNCLDRFQQTEDMKIIDIEQLVIKSIGSLKFVRILGI